MVVRNADPPSMRIPTFAFPSLCREGMGVGLAGVGLAGGVSSWFGSSPLLAWSSEQIFSPHVRVLRQINIIVGLNLS